MAEEPPGRAALSVTGKSSGLPPVLLCGSLIFVELRKRACVLFQIFINEGDGFARDLPHLLKQAARREGELAAFSPCVYGVPQIAAGKTVMSLFKNLKQSVSFVRSPQTGEFTNNFQCRPSRP
jgi:hypothetical protein